MRTSTWSRAGIATIAIVIGAATFGAGAEEPSKSNPTQISAGGLAENPGGFYGKRVSVRAEVESKHSPHLFTLDEDKVGATPDVLVVVPKGNAPEDGDEVVVIGTVRRYTRTELERDYDWFDLGAEYDVTYRERPVLVAESIVKIDD